MALFDQTRAYNNLPELPPAVQVESYAVLKKVIAATRALAELRVAGHLIPNQSVLIQALGLQEAKLSSEIENVVTTNDELYRAFADMDGKVDTQTKEVLRYKDAVWHGFNALKQKRLLTTPLYEELVQIIEGHAAGIRKNSGTTLKSDITGETVYTPPEGESVIRAKLSNLEQFIYSDDEIDPLVKMAIIHYQFEAIHPFPNGNGRTGRIVNILYLIHKGLLDIPVLYLSSYIMKNKPKYYNGLRNVTEQQAWESWILYILDGLEQTAITTKERIIQIHNLMNNTAKRVREKLPRIYSKDLVEALFCQPYCKIRFLEECGIAQRQTASNYLHELENIGILRSIKIGREYYYINDSLLNALQVV